MSDGNPAESLASKKWFGVKTGTMLVMFFVIFGLLGAFIGLLIHMIYPKFSLVWGVIIMLLIGVIVVILSISSHNRYVKDTLNKIEAEGENPRIKSIVINLSNKAGIDVPKVRIVHTEEMNAYTSSGKAGSFIVIYDSLIKALNEDELEGVIAHEISHLKDGDIFTTIMTSRLSNIIAVFSKYIGVGMLLAGLAMLGSVSGIGNAGKSIIGSIIVLAIALIGLVMVVIGGILCIFYPIAAILKMAISRDREYTADKSAGYLTGKPSALASALKKMEYTEIPQKQLNVNLADSMIVSHFDEKNIINRMMSTHPTIKSRVKHLMEQDMEINKDSMFSTVNDDVSKLGISLPKEKQYTETKEFADEVKRTADQIMSQLKIICDGTTDNITELDDKKAEYLSNKNAQIQAIVGLMYLFGVNGLRQSDKKAHEHLESASASGEYLAMAALGCMYAYGRYVKKDTETAYYWIKKAADCSDGAMTISVQMR